MFYQNTKKTPTNKGEKDDFFFFLNGGVRYIESDDAIKQARESTVLKRTFYDAFIVCWIPRI